MKEGAIRWVGVSAIGACVVAAVSAYFAFQSARDVAALRLQLHAEQQRSAAALLRLSNNVAALGSSSRVPCALGQFAAQDPAEPQGPMPALDPAAIDQVAAAVADRVDWGAAPPERALATAAAARSAQQLRAFDAGANAVEALLRSGTLTDDDLPRLAELTAGLHEEDRQLLRQRLSAAINAGQLSNEASDLPF